MKDIIKKPLFWIVVAVIIIIIIFRNKLFGATSNPCPSGQGMVNGVCTQLGQATKMAYGGNVNPISQRVNCKPGDQPKWVPANNVWGWLGWSGHWSCQTIPSN